MSLCSLSKGITPKICRLWVCVIINKRTFELYVFGSYSYRFSQTPFQKIGTASCFRIWMPDVNYGRWGWKVLLHC